MSAWYEWECSWSRIDAADVFDGRLKFVQEVREREVVVVGGYVGGLILPSGATHHLVSVDQHVHGGLNRTGVPNGPPIHAPPLAPTTQAARPLLPVFGGDLPPREVVEGPSALRHRSAGDLVCAELVDERHHVVEVELAALERVVRAVLVMGAGARPEERAGHQQHRAASRVRAHGSISSKGAPMAVSPRRSASLEPSAGAR
ncbi:MAG: hypothetical protein ACK559_03115, partial [bacterium]